MLGPDQPIILELLDLPMAQRLLKATLMELEDCAFPLLVKATPHTDPNSAFLDADFAILVGSRPRGPGMERSDLLFSNAAIFTEQGAALNAVASRQVKVLVVGNPANTNALIALKSAPDLSPSNFTALLRLDENRSKSILGTKLGVPVKEIENVIVWGNHSQTMYPDSRFVTVSGRPTKALLSEPQWVSNVYIPQVQTRGAMVIEQRGMSSAASAANAIIEHMRDWALGSNGRWVSMGLFSNGGESTYGIPADIVYGFPCICANGNYEIVRGLEIDEISRSAMNTTLKELLDEKAVIHQLLLK